VKAFLAAVVALVSAVFAVVTLRNLWGYRDSPTWFFVVVGGFWIALSVVFAFLAVREARRRAR
jgi:drug/metabolite transporter (DMT)-like permease